MTDFQKRQAHILAVDDDPKIRRMLVRYFEDEGYRIEAVADGAAMRQRLKSESIDIILLDIVLNGGENGLALAREICAETDVPVIMLTGRNDVVDRIVGLEVGADDYIAKPFHLREVLARVRTVLRRQRAAAVPGAVPDEEVVAFDNLQIDFRRRRLATADGTEVALTTAEFDLLRVFVQHAGRVLARDTLMNLLRGHAWQAFDRTIDAQVARLRKKIEHDSAHPELIKSVRGIGYVFTGKIAER